MNKAAILILFVLTVSSCHNNDVKPKLYYTPLKTYFASEASRLTRANPEVSKTAERNGTLETRRIRNIDWPSELGVFGESDINKPAWKDSYRVMRFRNRVIYRAADDDLRTRSIVIDFNANGTIKSVEIFNRTSNSLYTSSERLRYFPDSLYVINKDQQVLIAGENIYRVTGRLK